MSRLCLEILIQLNDIGLMYSDKVASVCHSNFSLLDSLVGLFFQHFPYLPCW